MKKFWNSLGITRLDLILVVFLFAISLILNLIGIGWALPSQERSSYYPQDANRWYIAPKEQGRLYQTSPYEPYHPDESFLLNAISNMNPTRLDFNPHFFNYPTLSIYLTAAVLEAGNVLGFVKLENSKDFYVANPQQMARIYILGRLLAALISSLGVVLLYFTGKVLFTAPIGFLSSLILAVMPVWVRDSHFMLINVPSAAFMISSALLAALSLKRYNPAVLIGSAILAGLAASTKYVAGAVIILPMFVLINHKPIRLRMIILLPVLCGLSFLAGSPYILVSMNEFIRDLTFEGGTKLGILSIPNLLQLLAISQGTVPFFITCIGILIALFGWRSIQNQFVFLWLLAGIFQGLMSNVFLVRYIIGALPPLAIFMAIALDPLREWVIRKNPPKANAVSWGVCLILLFPAIGYSLNIDRIMNSKDIRTTAAGWLATHVAPAGPIGIVAHIYFDTPPINAEKYQIIDLGKTDSVHLPPTLILTSVTRQYFSFQPPHDYQVTIFSQYPSEIWTWPINNKPLDWGYTFLDIDIYQSPSSLRKN